MSHADGALTANLPSVDVERVTAVLRALINNSSEFEDVCRLQSAKEAYEGIVNAYLQIDDVMSPSWPLHGATNTLKEKLVEAAFAKASKCRADVQAFLRRLCAIQKRIIEGISTCRSIRDVVVQRYGLQHAHDLPALTTLPLNSLVELAEEIGELCTQELVFKASLVEASAAPQPQELCRDQAQANLASWVARPFLKHARLATIREIFKCEQACVSV